MIPVVEFVLYDLPIVLDDDGAFVDEKVGVDSLADFEGQAEEGRAGGTVGDDRLRGAFIHPGEEIAGEAADLLHTETRTFRAFSFDGYDGLGFGLAPCVVVV